MNIPNKIEVPAPTAWPIVLAFGLMLVCAGMVTAASVSILGAVLAVSGRRGLVPASVAGGNSRVGSGGPRSRRH